MAIPVRLLRYLPFFIGTILSAVVIYFIVQMFLVVDDGEPERKQTVQKVTLLAPPQPPPPPPKVEEPPEPEVQEEVDIPEPEDVPDVPDAPPMGDDLGVDADGTGAGDGFGLIGRKGGRGLLDGDPNAAYAAKMQKAIEDLLIDNEQIRSRAYSVVAQLWVGEDGSITRAKLSRSTGDEIIDGALIELLTTTSMLASGPPIDMPQPVKLRISSRM